MAYLEQAGGEAWIRANKSAVESAGLVVTELGAACSGVVASVLTGFAGSTLESLKPKIREYLGRHAALASALKGMSWENLVNQVEGALEQDYKNMIDLTKAGIGQGVGGIHAGLYELLNATNLLTSSYLGLIQRVGIDPWIARGVNRISTPNIPDTPTAWMLKKLGVINQAQYKEYAIMEGWSPDLLTKLERVFEAAVPTSIMLDLARRDYVSWEVVKTQMRRFGWSESIIDKAVYLADQIPEPYRLADFTAKGLMEQSGNREAFSWFGMAAGWADMWAESQYQYPSVGILSEMLWRKTINQSQWSLFLRRMGWREEVIEAAAPLLELIPPAQDLVTMVVREVFEPENLVEAPSEFAKYMAMKGFNKEWSDRYWTMHFLPMPINLAYRNLHRGLWDKEQFLELLRIADLHPRWREDIYNVAFEPPSIREMGYGYDVGAYTRDDIIRYRRWGGLSEVDATKAADSLVAYRTEAEREALRRNYMYLYTLNHITLEEFGDALDSIGTNPEARLLWLERAELEKLRKELATPPEEPSNITRGTAQWLFERELRTEEWFRLVLEFLGYSADAIDAYTDQSLERIRLARVERETFVPRKLTLAQLTSLYKEERIDEETLLTGVIDLGYDFENAYVLTQQIIDSIYSPLGQREFTLAQMVNFFELDLVTDKDIHEFLERQGYLYPDATLLTQYIMITAALPDLKARYSKGWISAQQVYDALIELDVPKERANKIMMSIVKATQVERLEDERELTKAEIIKGAKNLVITPNEAVALLMDIGYEEWEAWYLLAINKVVAAGDPEGYWEMRRVTELFKRARGLPFVDIPQDVINLERLAKQARQKLNDAKAKPESDEVIGKLAVELNDAEARLKMTVARLKLK